TPKGQPVQLAALVLVLAGALGNLYDNLYFEPHPGLPGFLEGRSYGPVRDFIDVYFAPWDWHFWTFNVADSCISVGAVLLIAAGLFGGAARSAPA
ncbi:MAG: signal peptidase II, partial [Planctomycetota bacterium]